MQQFLRLHAKSDDFASTVARAGQFQDAQDLTKGKKPNIRLVETYEYSPETNANNAGVQPILDGLQKVMETVLEKQNKPSVRCTRPNSESKTENRNRRINPSGSQSPAPSDVSNSSNGSNGNRKTVRYSDQASTDRDSSRSSSRNGAFRDRRDLRSRFDQRQFNNGVRSYQWSNDQGQPPWRRPRSLSLLMVVRRLTNVVTGSDVGILRPMDQVLPPTVEAMNGIKSQQDHPVVLFAVNQDVVLDTTLTVADHLDRISPHVLFVSS